MLKVSTEEGIPLSILCFNITDHRMKIMASCMTLDEMEGANMDCNYKGRDSESLVKNPDIGIHLDCTFATITW